MGWARATRVSPAGHVLYKCAAAAACSSSGSLASISIPHPCSFQFSLFFLSSSFCLFFFSCGTMRHRKRACFARLIISCQIDTKTIDRALRMHALCPVCTRPRAQCAHTPGRETRRLGGAATGRCGKVRRFVLGEPCGVAAHPETRTKLQQRCLGQLLARSAPSSERPPGLVSWRTSRRPGQTVICP